MLATSIVVLEIREVLAPAAEPFKNLSDKNHHASQSKNKKKMLDVTFFK